MNNSDESSNLSGPIIFIDPTLIFIMIEFLLQPEVLVPLIIWSMFWKGWALWLAGNRKEKVWFIILFLVNTIGILDIIYIFMRRKKKK